jgi:hypothetical protein
VKTILYVSPHGPFEKGRDVITRTASGEIRAYQLKAGDIALSDWRQMYGEIANLVELAIELPGLTPIIEFVPYLVTNGEVTDPVLEQVRVANLSWQSRGISNKLSVIQKGELFERFRCSHGAYLPRELADFRTFLELVLHDGSEPAHKGKAAQLIEHVLPSQPESKNALDVARAAASIVLLAAYITGPATLAANHWCIFEYWVLAEAYILYLIQRCPMAESDCRVSLEICEMAAEAELRAIAEECRNRTDLVQGFPLVDGHAYGARVTIKRKPRTDIDFVPSFLATRLKEASMWGESAVPYLFLAALESEQNCKPQVAEGLVIQMVREISAGNGALGTGRGVPNPYYSPEEALRLNYGIDFLNAEQFGGRSYSVATLIDFLARRWRRQSLAGLWFALTRMSLTAYVPDTFAEWFRWKSENGVLDSHMPREPESWEVLRSGAEKISTNELPPMLVKRPAFALWFILVYPHRVTPALAKLIEDAIWHSVYQA